jgi:hypothetical protein
MLVCVCVCVCVCVWVTRSIGVGVAITLKTNNNNARWQPKTYHRQPRDQDDHDDDDDDVLLVRRSKKEECVRQSVTISSVSGCMQGGRQKKKDEDMRDLKHSEPTGLRT